YGPQAAAEPNHAAIEGGGSIAQPAPERPGLGTQWGETVKAAHSYSPLVRSSGSPWAQVVLHYNDAEGVAAHAQYVGARAAPLEGFAGDGSLSVARVAGDGCPLP